VRRFRSTIAFVGLAGMFLGIPALLGGCGGSDSSAVAVKSAEDYAQGVRAIEENNKKHIQAALAARKAGRSR
jgi:hypothetical protein